MNKGISFFFGYDIEPLLRAQMIKNAGFTHIITSYDKRFNKENGTLKTQINIFKKVGLQLSSLHSSYTSKNLPHFWEKGLNGYKIKKSLLKDIKLAKKYGFSCVVVHLLGQYSKVGEKRLLDILRYCEKENMPIAIENINQKQIFIDVFKNISSPMLKFCFDSGHSNVFDKDFDYLSAYNDKLITLHLHDNDVTLDQHTLTINNGTLDWNKIALGLVNHEDIILDYELLQKRNFDISASEFLKEAKKQADLLESLILANKK